MSTPASGDADSPIANRGCRPRSSNAKRYPRRRTIIARIDPPNPLPTMAMSGDSIERGTWALLVLLIVTRPGEQRQREAHDGDDERTDEGRLKAVDVKSQPERSGCGTRDQQH